MKQGRFVVYYVRNHLLTLIFAHGSRSIEQMKPFAHGHHVYVKGARDRKNPFDSNRLHNVNSN